eukprot:1150230-Pelagomonas_calceolata.AAC.1
MAFAVDDFDARSAWAGLSLHAWPVSRASLEATTVAGESGRPEPVWRFMRRVLLQHSSPKVGYKQSRLC